MTYGSHRHVGHRLDPFQGRDRPQQAVGVAEARVGRRRGGRASGGGLRREVGEGRVRLVVAPAGHGEAEVQQRHVADVLGDADALLRGLALEQGPQLDANMPGVDGLSALPDIVASAPDATVIMLSTADPADLAQESVRRGARGYLRKPERILDLPRMVEELVAA